MFTDIFEIANKFNGRVDEIPGGKHNPLIVYILQLAAGSDWPDKDEIAWCSAFVYFIAFLLGLERPRRKGLRARSWLLVGRRVEFADAHIGSDIVVLKRGGGNQPGPDVIDAKGHVGIFAGFSGDMVKVLGGNQGNAVNISSYPKSRILRIRRIL